jgi:hypothetical protein
VNVDVSGFKKGDYRAEGYGQQWLIVMPQMNTLIVNRVHIYPTVDETAIGRAFAQILRSLMTQAYTGERKEGASSSAKSIKPARELLVDYGAKGNG